MKSSVILIANPVAKRASRKKIEKACRYFNSSGCHVEVIFTERKGHAEFIAGEAAKRSPMMIVAAGGDGTFNEVANGIAHLAVPMAILPFGTTNVLAKEIGAPENVKGAIEFALNKTPKNISLGKIILSSDKKGNKEGRRGFRYFILMAGIGYDGRSVSGLNERLKRISGKGSYIYSGIKTLIKFNPDDLLFNIDGKTYSGHSAIIGKASKYGGHFKITPDAKLADPAFYVSIFKGKKRLDIVRYALGIMMGKHLKYRDIEYIKAKKIEVKGSAHVQLDGDYFGKTPALIEVIPDAIKLIF